MSWHSGNGYEKKYHMQHIRSTEVGGSVGRLVSGLPRMFSIEQASFSGSRALNYCERSTPWHVPRRLTLEYCADEVRSDDGRGCVQPQKSAGQRNGS